MIWNVAEAELRAVEMEGNIKVISGHPAVFNEVTNIGCWYREMIEPMAFEGCDMSDVLLLINHNTDAIPLARLKNGKGTMRLSVDAKGLQMRAEVDCANNNEAQKVYSSIKRGDILGMSFAFKVSHDEWVDLETKMPLRRIKQISKLYEVSIVNNPAYEATDVQARNAEVELKAARQQYQTVETDLREKIKVKGEMKL